MRTGPVALHDADMGLRVRPVQPKDVKSCVELDASHHKQWRRSGGLLEQLRPVLRPETMAGPLARQRPGQNDEIAKIVSLNRPGQMLQLYAGA